MTDLYKRINFAYYPQMSAVRYEKSRPPMLYTNIYISLFSPASILWIAFLQEITRSGLQVCTIKPLLTVLKVP